MRLDYNSKIAIDHGHQTALVYAYIMRRCKKGPARIRMAEVAQDLGINYEAWLRCRKLLESEQKIKQGLNSHQEKWVALPGQKFPFRALMRKTVLID